MESRRQSEVEWLVASCHTICTLYHQAFLFQASATATSNITHKVLISTKQYKKFPSESISAVEASHIIKEAFPSSQSKHFTSGNRVLGVQWKIPPMSNPVPVLVATGQPLGELELERQKNSQLVAKVQDLEATVRQQKQQLASMVDPVSLLVGQFDQVLQHSTHQVFHGPDTVEHFNAFSVDEVIRELKSDAPDVYQLFQSLGNTQREKTIKRHIPWRN